MEKIISKTIACPSCGHDKFNPEKECVCGYHADESFLVDTFLMESEDTGSADLNEKSTHKINKLRKGKSSDEQVIKEIDSWAFSFSPDDNCILLGTPALQSFSLKLNTDDLEELLEYMYKKTGQNKTTRKLRLSAIEANDIVTTIHDMIEEKKAKTALNFSGNELRDMATLINQKLKA
jgi:hypothetical protein